MNKQNKSWTAKDSNTALDMRQDGKSYNDIAEALGRTPAGVQVHISKIRSRAAPVKPVKAKARISVKAKSDFPLELVALALVSGCIIGALIERFII